MNKKILALFLVIFNALIIGLGISKMEIKASGNYDDFFYIITTPAENTNNAMNINWHTKIASSKLEYTKASDKDFKNAITVVPNEKLWDIKDQANADVNDSFYTNTRYVCSVELSNLEERTKYIYRIKGNDKYSDVYTFTTSGLTNNWNFMAFVDFQSEFNPNVHPLITKIKEVSNNPSLAVCSGDLTDVGGHEAEWKWLLNNDVFSDFIFATTNGDHEYMTTSVSPIKYFSTPHTFNAIFNNPKNGASGVENSNYYFYYNNVLFVFLDMNDSNTSKGSRFTAQEEWFDNLMPTLEGTYQYLVVLAHKSIYGSKNIDTGVRKYITPQWSPLFDKYNVDLFIGGHDHVYSRTYPIKDNAIDENGTYYLDMGSSGNKYREPTEDLLTDGLHEKVMNLKEIKQPCGANITVSENNMVVDVYNIKGELVDNFTINKKREPLVYDYSNFLEDDLDVSFKIETTNDGGKLYFLDNDNFKYVKHVKVQREDGFTVFDDDVNIINSGSIDLKNLKGLNYKVTITTFSSIIKEYFVKADIGELTFTKITTDSSGMYLRFNNNSTNLVSIQYDLYIDDDFICTISKSEIENNKIALNNTVLVGTHTVSVKMIVNEEALKTLDYQTVGMDELVLKTNSTLNLKKGDKVLIDYEFSDDSLLNISSSNSKIISIENGYIVANKNGKAKVNIDIVDSTYHYEIECNVKSNNVCWIVISISVISISLLTFIIILKKKKKKMV